jgi:hypothetical protein
MTPTNWASLIVAGIAVVTAFAGTIRWMVKHYLYELRPNGGDSLKVVLSNSISLLVQAQLFQLWLLSRVWFQFSSNAAWYIVR